MEQQEIQNIQLNLIKLKSLQKFSNTIDEQGKQMKYEKIINTLPGFTFYH